MRIVSAVVFAAVVLGGLIWNKDVGESQAIRSALPTAVGTPPGNPSTPGTARCFAKTPSRG